MVARARDEGVELTGERGLLTGLVRQVLQTGLEVEMADQLGYERHAEEGRGSGNSRNGTTPKTVTTEIGRVDLAVPRDRAGTFAPVTGRAPSISAASRGGRSAVGRVGPLVVAMGPRREGRRGAVWCRRRLSLNGLLA